MLDLGGGLTDDGYWNRYWADWRSQLPAVVSRRRDNLQVNAILDVLDTYVAESGASVLEVGGAPGQYLAYLHRRFGCKCELLDFSATGCALARENLRLLGVEAVVHERDMFAPDLDIGTFDIVYSLGLLEHFDDLATVMRAHVRLVRDGGTLIVGVPNLRGINHWFLKRLSPARLSVHNLVAMDVDEWTNFEALLGLERRFLAHVGGFEPAMFAAVEPGVGRARGALLLARLLQRALGSHGPRLRRLNHRSLSGYLIGAWTVTRDTPEPEPPA